MKYLSDVLAHKWYVLVAGLRIGGIPLWNLLIHDLSKFSPIEFVTYRRRFGGGKFSVDEWNRAWLHHIHRNPHHWEHWILKGEPLEMPEKYAREMVADWMAASRAYTGNWDMRDWLMRKYDKLALHPRTRTYVSSILKSIGY